MPGPPGDPSRFSEWFEFTPAPSCAVSNPTDLMREAELRVFVGQGVQRRVALDFLGGLQRYYSNYGVTMRARHEMIDVPIRRALITDELAIAVRVDEQTGINPLAQNIEALSSSDQTRVRLAIGRAFMHNVRELIRVYGKPALPTVNVVLLEDIMPDDKPKELEDVTLVGLGLSKELLSSFPEDDPARELYVWAGDDHGEDLTPTAIVGVDSTRRLLSAPDVVIAHEVGHAFGLTHTTIPGNLLRQGEIGCDLELDSSQLARVSEATKQLSHLLAPESLSLTSRAGEIVARLDRHWRRISRERAG